MTGGQPTQRLLSFLSCTHFKLKKMRTKAYYTTYALSFAFVSLLFIFAIRCKYKINQ